MCVSLSPLTPCSFSLPLNSTQLNSTLPYPTPILIPSTTTTTTTTAYGDQASQELKRFGTASKNADSVAYFARDARQVPTKGDFNETTANFKLPAQATPSSSSPVAASSPASPAASTGGNFGGLFGGGSGNGGDGAGSSSGGGRCFTLVFFPICF